MHMRRSVILEKADKTEIGRKLIGRFTSPDLKTGTTLAIFQLKG